MDDSNSTEWLLLAIIKSFYCLAVPRFVQVTRNRISKVNLLRDSRKWQNTFKSKIIRSTN